MSIASRGVGNRMVWCAAMLLLVAAMFSGCPSNEGLDPPDAQVLRPCTAAVEPETSIEARLGVFQYSASGPEYFNASWREDLAEQSVPDAGSLGCIDTCRIESLGFGGDGGVRDGGSPSLALLAMAGTVTIEGVGAGAIVLTASTPFFLQQDARGIEGGEHVVARGTGTPGGLSAFEAQWSAPAQVAIEEPLLGREAASVDPSMDLNVVWTPSPAGEGTLILTIYGSVSRDEIWGSRGAAATCRFPARSGQAVIPGAVLRAFADYSRDQVLSVSAEVVDSIRMEVDGHPILFVTDISIAWGRFDIGEPDAGVVDVRDAGPFDSALGRDS